MSALIPRIGRTQASVKIAALGLSLVMSGCLPEGRTTEQLLSESNDGGGPAVGSCTGWKGTQTQTLAKCVSTCISKDLPTAGYPLCINNCVIDATDDKACQDCWDEHLTGECKNLREDCEKQCPPAVDPALLCTNCFKLKCGEPNCL